MIGSAEAGKGRDAQGYRGEFIRLVKTARDLALPDEAGGKKRGDCEHWR